MTSAKTRRKKSVFGRYFGGGCSILLVLIAVWWMAAQTPPAIIIPTPTLPSPNAFDTFLLASSQLLESKKIDNATYTPEAAKQAHIPILALSERQKLVSENSTALATLRQGLDEPYWNPPSRSFYTLMPYYAKFRGLARFLAFESNVRSATGDYNGAVRSPLDAIAMGGQIPRGSTVIGALVGMACQAIGRKPIWPLIDHLDSAHAMDAVRRLEKIRQNEFSEAETLQEEKWAGQAGLIEFFRSKDPGNLFALMSSESDEATKIPAFNNATASIFYMVYSKQRIMNDYTLYMDAGIRLAKEPFHAGRRQAKTTSDPIVNLLTPVFDGMSTKYRNTRVQNALLETAFALRAFKLLHGGYPTYLAELSPRIMKTQPTDPFTEGSPLHYKRVCSSYLLYSVGPDGVDDGGKVIDTGPSPDGTSNQRYFINENSKGDIVAGKNRW